MMPTASRLQIRRLRRLSSIAPAGLAVLFTALQPLAQELDQDNPYVSYTIGAPGNISEVAIKGETGTSAVQPGGTYNFSIPIEVPPGPRGTAPRIALVYTGEGNGWVGKGWSLSFGAVTRDTRNGVPTDLGLPDSNDEFLLNGTRLIKVTGQNRYRTEIESHQHISFATDPNNPYGQWVVKDPDGTVSYYSERVIAYPHPNLDPGDPNEIGTREWLLKQVKDTKGNTIDYLYKPLSWTVRYPTAIVWGEGTGTRKAVRFVLDPEPRTDKRTSFATGSHVVEDRRLASIEVRWGTAADGTGGTLLRKYLLQPEYGPETGALRLASVTETGLDEQGPERTTTFTYTVSSTDLESDNDPNGFLSGLPMDVDSDAFLQTSRVEHVCPNGEHPAAGESGCEGQEGPPKLLHATYKSNVQFADIDNDGIPEYIQGAGGPFGIDTNYPHDNPDPLTSQVWKVNDAFDGWEESNDPLLVPAPFRRWQEGINVAEDFGARFLDLDRNGTQDLLLSYEFTPSNSIGTMYAGEFAWFNTVVDTSVVWSPREDISFPTVSQKKLRLSWYGEDSGVRIADVNSDGRPDLIHAYEPDDWWRILPDYPYHRDAVDDCYYGGLRPRPPGGQGVYLMEPNGTWPPSPNPNFELPYGVYFVGLAPADAFLWRCPDAVPPNTCDGRQAERGTLDVDFGTQILDVNGDGLPDIVKATSYPYDCGEGSVGDCTILGGCDCDTWKECATDSFWPGTQNGNGVYLNTGRGWKRTGSWTSSLQDQVRAYLHNPDVLCKVDCDAPFMLLDFNDDGLPDIQEHRANGNYYYYRNTGDGWDPNEVQISGIAFGQGQVFQDFDGDGRPDYFKAARFENWPLTELPSTGHEYWEFKHSDPNHPDQLQFVDNWLGGRIELKYGHSSEWREDHDGELPQTRYVVKTLTRRASPSNSNLEARDPNYVTANGVPGVSTTGYEYRKGKFDFGDREFRGFGRMTATSEDGNTPGDLITDTYYHQDDALKGLVDKTLVFDSNDVIIRATDYQWNCEADPDDCRPIVNGSALLGIYDRRLQQEKAMEDCTLDAETEVLSCATILNQIDSVYDQPGDYGQNSEAFGNLKERIESGPLGDGSHRRRTKWFYKPNTSSWLVNYPSMTQGYVVSATGDILGDQVLSSYDHQAWDTPPSAGLLTRTESRNVFEGVEAPDVVTEMDHDGWGNKISEKNANGQITRFTYDSTASFLTAITNPLGQAVSFFYHGVNAPTDGRSSALIPGALQKFVDPNGAETFYSYDSLGRLLKLFQSPDIQTEQVVYEYFFKSDDPNLPADKQRVKISTRTQASDYFVTVHWLDGLGRIVQTRSELPDATPGSLPDWATVVTRQYDLLGRPWRTSLPKQFPVSDPNYIVPDANTVWSRTTYDLLGRPTDELSFDNTKKEFEYDGLRVKVINERQFHKDLEYDSQGRLWQVTELPNSSSPLVTRYEYNILGGLRKIISLDDPTHPTEYNYDTLGRRRRMIHPDRGTWTYEYDGLGNLVEQKDAKGKVLRFDHDELGRLTQKHTTDPNTPHKLLGKFYYDNQQPVDGDNLDALTQEVAFYDWGTAVTGLPSWANGYSFTGLVQDPNHSALAYCPPGPYVPPNNYTCTPYSAWLDHRIHGQSDAPLSLTMTFQDYANLHFFVQFIDPNDTQVGVNSGNMATGTGQRVTRRISVPVDRYPQIVTVRLKYYYGKLEIFHTSLEKTSGGAPDVFDPNAASYVAQNGNGVMAPVAGNPRTYKADSVPYPPLETARSYRPDGVQHIVPNSVDELLTLNLKLVDTPGSEVYVDLYDASNGNMGRVSENLTPSGSGQIITRQVPVDLYLQQYSTVTNVYVHATVGRLELLDSFLARGTGKPLYHDAQETPSPSSSSFAVKNGIGRMTAFLDDTGQTIFSYDLRGNVLQQRKAVDGDGYRTEHTYAYDNLPVTLTYPNGEVVTQTYDAARRLVAMSSSALDPALTPLQPLKLIRDVTYNSYGLLEHVGYGQKPGTTNPRFISDYDYFLPESDPNRPDLRLKTLRTEDLYASPLLQDLGYVYDAVGNVKVVTDPGSTATQGAAAGVYDYDSLDRLTEAVIGPQALTLGFTFDPIGNLTFFENHEQIYGGSCKPHQLCFESGRDYQYDANGNLLRRSVSGVAKWRLTYDVENRLKLAEDLVADRTVAARYDAQGARVERTLTPGSGHSTFYPGPHYEKRPEVGDGTTILYHAFGRLIAERKQVGETEEEVQFRFSDHLGSASVVRSTATGVAGWAETYRPFGWDFSGNEPTNATYKFTGQEQDLEWLYNFKARAYLPGVGVFAQADTWEGKPENPQTLNPYAYALGNPLKYNDPSGNCPICFGLVVLAIGALSDPDFADAPETERTVEQAEAEYRAHDVVPLVGAGITLGMSAPGLMKGLLTAGAGASESAAAAASVGIRGVRGNPNTVITVASSESGSLNGVVTGAYGAIKGTVPGSQAHHIIQNAAVEGIQGATKSGAPAVAVQGSMVRGTAHNLASQAQRNTNVLASGITRGTYGAEQSVAKLALKAAGFNDNQINRLAFVANRYFEKLGFTSDTITNIPKQ